ncbi:unnamed protein product [Amoebophrya sp. A120]|nr:unnamed protein product [Amoebophrya sp. A120]|eukprot:GSA120T00005163001.1
MTVSATTGDGDGVGNPEDDASSSHSDSSASDREPIEWPDELRALPLMRVHEKPLVARSAMPLPAPPLRKNDLPEWELDPSLVVPMCEEISKDSGHSQFVDRVKELVGGTTSAGTGAIGSGPSLGGSHLLHVNNSASSPKLPARGATSPRPRSPLGGGARSSVGGDHQHDSLAAILSGSRSSSSSALSSATVAAVVAPASSYILSGNGTTIPAAKDYQVEKHITSGAGNKDHNSSSAHDKDPPLAHLAEPPLQQGVIVYMRPGSQKEMVPNRYVDLIQLTQGPEFEDVCPPLLESYSSAGQKTMMEANLAFGGVNTLERSKPQSMVTLVDKSADIIVPEYAYNGSSSTSSSSSSAGERADVPEATARSKLSVVNQMATTSSSSDSDGRRILNQAALSSGSDIDAAMLTDQVTFKNANGVVPVPAADHGTDLATSGIEPPPSSPRQRKVRLSSADIYVEQPPAVKTTTAAGGAAAVTAEVVAPSPDRANKYHEHLNKSSERRRRMSATDIEHLLAFDSHFESGNLAAAFLVLPRKDARVVYGKDEIGSTFKTIPRYELVLDEDTNSNGNTQWYYFAVRNALKGETVDFSIVNLGKAQSLYHCGLKPLCYSQKAAELNKRNKEREKTRKGVSVLSPSKGGGGSSSSSSTAGGGRAGGWHRNFRKSSGGQLWGTALTHAFDRMQAARVANKNAALRNGPTVVVAGDPEEVSKSISDIPAAATTYPLAGWRRCGTNISYDCAQLTKRQLRHKLAGLRVGDFIGADVLSDDTLWKYSTPESNFETGSAFLYHKIAHSNSDSDVNNGGNASDASRESGTDGRMLHRLNFRYTFEHDNDVVYFAYTYPYTFSRLNRVLENLNKEFSYTTMLCKTLAQNWVDIVTVTDRSKASKGKAIIFVTARVHPGETPASYIMEGFLKFLTHPTDVRAIELRKNFIFKCVPMLNPDGVVCGNYRTSLVGCDLNRRWRQESKALHPTIFHTKRLIRRLCGLGQVACFVDLHGHSRKFNWFTYGCTTAEMGSGTNRDPRLLPFSIRKISNTFSLACSNFAMPAYKDQTARVAVATELDVLSYTVEASLGGGMRRPPPGEPDFARQNVHFTVADYIRMGVELALNFLTRIPKRAPKRPGQTSSSQSEAEVVSKQGEKSDGAVLGKLKKVQKTSSSGGPSAGATEREQRGGHQTEKTEMNTKPKTSDNALVATKLDALQQVDSTSSAAKACSSSVAEDSSASMQSDKKLSDEGATADKNETQHPDLAAGQDVSLLNKSSSKQTNASSQGEEIDFDFAGFQADLVKHGHDSESDPELRSDHEEETEYLKRNLPAEGEVETLKLKEKKKKKRRSKRPATPHVKSRYLLGVHGGPLVASSSHTTVKAGAAAAITPAKESSAATPGGKDLTRPQTLSSVSDVGPASDGAKQMERSGSAGTLENNRDLVNSILRPRSRTTSDHLFMGHKKAAEEEEMPSGSKPGDPLEPATNAKALADDTTAAEVQAAATAARPSGEQNTLQTGAAATEDLERTSMLLDHDRSLNDDELTRTLDLADSKEQPLTYFAEKTDNEDELVATTVHTPEQSVALGDDQLAARAAKDLDDVVASKNSTTLSGGDSAQLNPGDSQTVPIRKFEHKLQGTPSQKCFPSRKVRGNGTTKGNNPPASPAIWSSSRAISDHDSRRPSTTPSRSRAASGGSIAQMVGTTPNKNSGEYQPSGALEVSGENAANGARFFARGELPSSWTKLPMGELFGDDRDTSTRAGSSCSSSCAEEDDQQGFTGEELRLHPLVAGRQPIGSGIIAAAQSKLTGRDRRGLPPSGVNSKTGTSKPKTTHIRPFAQADFAEHVKKRGLLNSAGVPPLMVKQARSAGLYQNRPQTAAGDGGDSLSSSLKDVAHVVGSSAARPRSRPSSGRPAARTGGASSTSRPSSAQRSRPTSRPSSAQSHRSNPLQIDLSSTQEDVVDEFIARGPQHGSAQAAQVPELVHQQQQAQPPPRRRQLIDVDHNSGLEDPNTTSMEFMERGSSFGGDLTADENDRQESLSGSLKSVGTMRSNFTSSSAASEVSKVLKQSFKPKTSYVGFTKPAAPLQIPRQKETGPVHAQARSGGSKSSKTGSTASSSSGGGNKSARPGNRAPHNSPLVTQYAGGCLHPVVRNVRAPATTPCKSSANVTPLREEYLPPDLASAPKQAQVLSSDVRDDEFQQPGLGFDAGSDMIVNHFPPGTPSGGLNSVILEPGLALPSNSWTASSPGGVPLLAEPEQSLKKLPGNHKAPHLLIRSGLGLEMVQNARDGVAASTSSAEWVASAKLPQEFTPACVTSVGAGQNLPGKADEISSATSHTISGLANWNLVPMEQRDSTSTTAISPINATRLRSAPSSQDLVPTGGSSASSPDRDLNQHNTRSGNYPTSKLGFNYQIPVPNQRPTTTAGTVHGGGRGVNRSITSEIGPLEQEPSIIVKEFSFIDEEESRLMERQVGGKPKAAGGARCPLRHKPGTPASPSKKMSPQAMRFSSASIPSLAQERQNNASPANKSFGAQQQPLRTTSPMLVASPSPPIEVPMNKMHGETMTNSASSSTMVEATIDSAAAASSLGVSVSSKVLTALDGATLNHADPTSNAGGPPADTVTTALASPPSEKNHIAVVRGLRGNNKRNQALHQNGALGENDVGGGLLVSPLGGGPSPVGISLKNSGIQARPATAEPTAPPSSVTKMHQGHQQNNSSPADYGELATSAKPSPTDATMAEAALNNKLDDEFLITKNSLVLEPISGFHEQEQNIRNAATGGFGHLHNQARNRMPKFLQAQQNKTHGSSLFGSNKTSTNPSPLLRPMTSPGVTAGAGGASSPLLDNKGGSYVSNIVMGAKSTTGGTVVGTTKASASTTKAAASPPLRSAAPVLHTPLTLESATSPPPDAKLSSSGGIDGSRENLHEQHMTKSEPMATNANALRRPSDPSSGRSENLKPSKMVVNGSSTVGSSTIASPVLDETTDTTLKKATGPPFPLTKPAALSPLFPASCSQPSPQLPLPHDNKLAPLSSKDSTDATSAVKPSTPNAANRHMAKKDPNLASFLPELPSAKTSSPGAPQSPVQIDFTTTFPNMLPVEALKFAPNYPAGSAESTPQIDDAELQEVEMGSSFSRAFPASTKNRERPPSAGINMDLWVKRRVITHDGKHTTETAKNISNIKPTFVHTQSQKSSNWMSPRASTIAADSPLMEKITVISSSTVNGNAVDPQETSFLDEDGTSPKMLADSRLAGGTSGGGMVNFNALDGSDLDFDLKFGESSPVKLPTTMAVNITGGKNGAAGGKRAAFGAAAALVGAATKVAKKKAKSSKSSSSSGTSGSSSSGKKKKK